MIAFLVQRFPLKKLTQTSILAWGHKNKDLCHDCWWCVRPGCCATGDNPHDASTCLYCSELCTHKKRENYISSCTQDTNNVKSADSPCGINAWVDGYAGR